MSKILVSFLVECKKFFRSKVPFLTALALLFLPFVGGLFMIILKDPALARQMGIISAKAQLAGTADWSSYFGLLAQGVSIGGLFVFGFTTSWVFGREYSDRTIKDLLALPISRSTIVLSKFMLIFLWCLLLAGMVFAVGLAVVNAVDIPGKSLALIQHGAFVFFTCAILTILLSTPIGLVASIGRGYLSPLGFMVFTMVLAQIIAATGYGHLFPWSIPALASGAAGSENAALGGISLVIVILTSAIGLMGTLFWWSRVDQT